ncbi:MAG: SusC/RagA family TonB-linked outer membrane protein, partial [Chitinophagaceae bacterium]
MTQKLRLILCLLALVCFLGKAEAQTIQVTGTVTRATNNEPLAGATVSVKGTGSATTTNEQGAFTITVPERGATLVVSFSGLTEQEAPVTGTGPMNFALQERSTGTLNEVVVVGYGAQRRGNVTGSIGTVTSRELVQAPVADLSNALQGRVAGVITKQGSGAPGGDGAGIFIRGVSTFGGGTEPLYVIDGIVRGRNDFTQLDASEVESVSVLKDASSAAIFGVKGANGVVLVTTKRGRAGRITANYSVNYGVQRVTKFNDNLGSYEYSTLLNEALLNDGLPLAFTNDEIEKFRSGADPLLYPNTNWQRLVLGGTAPQMQHNLSLSGGTDRVRYFASLGYLDQDGLYSSLNFKRYNLRSNLDMNVTRTTRFSLDISGRIENRNSPTTGISQIFEHT